VAAVIERAHQAAVADALAFIPVQALHLAQQATLETRDAKHEPRSLTEATRDVVERGGSSARAFRRRAAPRRRPSRHLGLHRVPEGGVAANLVQQSQERPNRIRRRTDVVGISPDWTALIRLVGVVLAEQHDEWTEQRRYLGLDILAKSRLIKITNKNPHRRGGDHHRHHRIESRNKIA
jgi:hypothetical protein